MLRETFCQKTVNEKGVNVDNEGKAIEANKSLDRGKHILMFHPWNVKSWMIQQRVLLTELLARGHYVTAVFPFKSGVKDARYTEILVKDG